MAISLTKGNMMMSLNLGIKLLLTLSMLCFQSVCVKGRELSRTRALGVEGRRRVLFHTYNVKSFTAQADDETDDTHAFISAWKKACESEGGVKLVVPKGTYLIGPVKFSGPCQNVSSLTVRMEARL
ncbi:Pectate lyase superfamily protein [Trema orientale]|uniref:Pectate lyase superfamily protein n=1 Tax=Trema orientale TaxID=63057 RepID=A0A2P5AE62_TREOI|nr:Pectate lyase superfamily protein [Trema orientale]